MAPQGVDWCGTKPNLKPNSCVNSNENIFMAWKYRAQFGMELKPTQINWFMPSWGRAKPPCHAHPGQGPARPVHACENIESKEPKLFQISGKFTGINDTHLPKISGQLPTHRWFNQISDTFKESETGLYTLCMSKH